MKYNRRKFIKGMAVATAAVPFTGVLTSAASIMESKQYPIHFFTKPLDKYEDDFMSEILKMAGIEGFDLTVRPKGRVLPERVADDLPKMVELAGKHNLLLDMMVTSINKPIDPFTEKVLTTAATNGIKHYRLAYYNYDNKLGVWNSISQIKAEMKALAELNKSIGIQGGYQNHSGTGFGAPMWDLWEVLRDIPKEWMSSQFDIRHAACEGSNSWILSLELLAKNIGSLAIKDFIWDVSTSRARVESVPLGEGIVNFDLYFKTLKDMNIIAPITLHVEYPLLKKEEEGLSLLQKQKIIVSKIKKDVEFIRMYLSKYQLI